MAKESEKNPRNSSSSNNSNETFISMEMPPQPSKTLSLLPQQVQIVLTTLHNVHYITVHVCPNTVVLTIPVHGTIPVHAHACPNFQPYYR